MQISYMDLSTIGRGIILIIQVMMTMMMMWKMP